MKTHIHKTQTIPTMQKNILYRCSVILLIMLLTACKSVSYDVSTENGKGSMQPFELSDVALLESPFYEAIQSNRSYIMAMEPDRLLAPYLREAGLKPKAESYTNWENTGLDGHIGGHYLSSLSLLYAATGDAEAKTRLDYMIDELKRCQEALGTGYIGGVPGGVAMWKEIEAGNIRASSFGLNNKWVPLYNIHKTYAGLIDAFRYGKSQKAWDMLLAYVDWAVELTKNLSDEQMQDMLRSEHGGLNEVFAWVAEQTGNETYLALAKRFSHQFVLQPLLAHQDRLTGMHANTQIPKVIGFKAIADLSSDTSWNSAARYFWDVVQRDRSISIGGNSVREHFHPASDFSSMLESEQGPETCNTYNMLKLTRQFLLSEGGEDYWAFYERAQYNHILSTINREHMGLVYFTPMRPGHYRVYSQPSTSMWCCVGSGIENHFKYGEMIYTHRDSDVLVNLFIPSVLTWEEMGLKLTQETHFPEADETRLTLSLEQPSEFGLYVRIPEWVQGEVVELRINGQKATVAKPDDGGYVCIRRVWSDGDAVRVALPMDVEAEQLPDGSSHFSFRYGPVVLASATDTSDMPGLYADDSRGGHIAHGPKRSVSEMPVLIRETENPADAVKMLRGKGLQFELKAFDRSGEKKMRLEPFYNVHDTRYIVYWRSESRAVLDSLRQVEAQAEAEKQALEARTIDVVFPGEQQPESDHGVTFESSENGIHEGRHWRHATGWFAYELKDAKKEAVSLQVMYYGRDAGRRFRILINDVVLANVELQRMGARFYTVDYPISDAVVAASNGLYRLRFEAEPGSIAGGVFEVRLLRK